MKGGTLFKAYHGSLRVCAAVVAVVLIFDSGLLSPVTTELSQNALRYTANVVGVEASVTPTELNMYTAELSARERELDRRERELAVGLNSESNAANNVSTYILSALLFIILVLIILNYSLDLARDRQVRALTKQLAHE